MMYADLYDSSFSSHENKCIGKDRTAKSWDEVKVEMQLPITLSLLWQIVDFIEAYYLHS